MKAITLILTIFLISGTCYAQTWIKMSGKVTESPLVLEDGTEVQKGTTIALDKGSNFDGTYKHIYSMIGMQLVPLGYGMDYETVQVKEIRHQKKTDTYFAIVEIQGRSYIAEVDKVIKSGEGKLVEDGR